MESRHQEGRKDTVFWELLEERNTRQLAPEIIQKDLTQSLSGEQSELQTNFSICAADRGT